MAGIDQSVTNILPDLYVFDDKIYIYIYIYKIRVLMIPRAGVPQIRYGALSLIEIVDFVELGFSIGMISWNPVIYISGS